MGKRPSRLQRKNPLVVIHHFMLPTIAKNKGQSQVVQRGTRKKTKQQHAKKDKINKVKVQSDQSKRIETSSKRKQRQDKRSRQMQVLSDPLIRCTTNCSASYSVLQVKNDTDVLTGLYWILLTRDIVRPCVITLPTHYELSSIELSRMLKYLGLQAMALHCKMTASQRKETVQRFQASMMVSHAMVLVTTDHLLSSIAYDKADVVLVGAVSAAATEMAKTKCAHVHQVTGSAAGASKTQQLSSSYCPELTTPCLQQLQARIKLVRQIMDVAQHIGKTGAAQDNDDKWVRKLAKEADLSDNEDAIAPKKKRKGTMTPNEQRLQALVAKLYVMLTRKLAGTGSTAANTLIVGEQKTDCQHRREKLKVLGLVTMNAAVGTAITDERTSAQTRWMDFAEGRAYGGQWNGSVRHGASKDVASLALRERLCAAKGKAIDLGYLSKWEPNKEPVNTEKWGGMFGKVCGHNEVVMNDLRAFYPQEVLNSKVCSKIFPAPGNQGFDGCLELLRFACMTQKMSMTLWDAVYFIFISTRGRVTWSKKSQLFSLSLASLLCLVPALRSWTAACGGHMPPSAVLRAIQLCCQLGCGDKRGKLPRKATKRIMSLAFGGSARIWRQIAKVSTPLEAEIVYDSQ